MTQAKHPLARLTHHGKGLGKDVVQTVAFRNARLELLGFGRQLRIIQRLNVVRQGVDLLDHFTHTFQLATVACAENVLQCFT